MAHRQNVSSLGTADRTKLRNFLDQYIAKPNDNPVTEHKLAGQDMSLMIHEMGFIAWHQHFIAKLENWLATNGGGQFVPVPFWDPAKPIPLELNKSNNNVNMPLPANLSVAALKTIASYDVLNARLVPYHGAVHDAAGGQMPNTDTSPSDPIFWPFHSFLLGVYERWRNI